MRQDDAELLTAQEARQVLRLGKNAIYELARRREIAYVRIGNRLLFPRQAIEAFIQSHTVPAARNYFSVNRQALRHYPGRRPIPEKHMQLPESEYQDCSHFAPPDENIGQEMVNVNLKRSCCSEIKSEGGNI